VVALLHDGLVDRLLDAALDGLVGRLVAGLVAGLGFFAVAGLAHRLHDGLLDRLVAGVEALLEHGIVHQLVGGPALLLTRAETGLCVATGLRTAGVLGGAQEGGLRRRGPVQGHDGSRQRRTQAHPHDLASSNPAPEGPLVGTSTVPWAGGTG